MGKTAAAKAEEHPLKDPVLLALSAVVPSRHQNRMFPETPDESLLELAESVRVHGVRQPILARPVSDRTPASYELVYGERRLRACRIAGKSTIPAFIETLSDEEAAALTVVENLQREDLTALEEARGIETLVALYGDAETVADRLGRPPAWVARRARLAHLTESWRTAAADPENPVSGWPAGALDVVARLSPEAQEAFYQERRYHLNSRPRIVDVERLVASHLRVLGKAPWGLEDPDLVPEAGACSACPKRSSREPLLFAELEGGGVAADDRCTDATCWNRKMDAHVEALVARLEAEHGEVIRVRTYYHPNASKAVGVLRGSVERGTVKEVRKKAGTPCVYVDGDKKGQWFWGERVRRTSGGGEKSAGPKPLKERREALQRRRLKLAIERLVTAVWDATESGKAPALVTLAALATAVGTKHDREGAPNAGPYSYLGLEDYQAFPNRKKSSPLPSLPGWPPKGVRQGRMLWPMVEAYIGAEDALRRDLWLAVWAVLRSRLSYGSHVDVELQWVEAEGIGALFDVDTAAILRKAEDEIPEPKSWAKLREDGTPKTAAKDKKKTAKKPVKRSKPKTRKRKEAKAK